MNCNTLRRLVYECPLNCEFSFTRKGPDTGLLSFFWNGRVHDYVVSRQDPDSELAPMFVQIDAYNVLRLRVYLKWVSNGGEWVSSWFLVS